jgi:hypothetical protein
VTAGRTKAEIELEVDRLTRQREAFDLVGRLLQQHGVEVVSDLPPQALAEVSEAFAKVPPETAA